jgi:hypothetical protein
LLSLRQSAQIILAVVFTVSNTRALDQTDILVAVYEYAINQWATSGTTICLTRSGLIPIEKVETIQNVGQGASNDVIRILRQKGYDAVSSDGCVLDHSHLRTRSSSKSAVLVSATLKENKESSKKISSYVAYWGAPLSCEGHTVWLEYHDGRYVIVDKEPGIIC